MSAALSITDLRVTFKTLLGEVQAVRGVSLDVQPGEVVGVVGESGSGKSVSFLAVMGLLPKSAKITGSAKVMTLEPTFAGAPSLTQVRLIAAPCRSNFDKIINSSGHRASARG